MADDLDLPAVHVVLARRLPAWLLDTTPRQLLLIPAVLGGVGLVDDLTGVVDRLLPLLHRLAVEFGVGELPGRRPGVIDDVEGELPVVRA